MLQKAGIPEVNGFSADIFLSSLGGRLDIVEANIRQLGLSDNFYPVLHNQQIIIAE